MLPRLSIDADSEDDSADAAARHRLGPYHLYVTRSSLLVSMPPGPLALHASDVYLAGGAFSKHACCRPCWLPCAGQLPIDLVCLSWSSGPACPLSSASFTCARPRAAYMPYALHCIFCWRAPQPHMCRPSGCAIAVVLDYFTDTYTEKHYVIWPIIPHWFANALVPGLLCQHAPGRVVCWWLPALAMHLPVSGLVRLPGTKSCALARFSIVPLARCCWSWLPARHVPRAVGAQGSRLEVWALALASFGVCLWLMDVLGSSRHRCDVLHWHHAPAGGCLRHRLHRRPHWCAYIAVRARLRPAP